MAAVEAFMRLISLFETPGPFGGRCGLDYSGVRAGLELAGIDVTETLWAQIQVIEHGAIDAILERGS